MRYTLFHVFLCFCLLAPVMSVQAQADGAGAEGVVDERATLERSLSALRHVTAVCLLASQRGDDSGLKSVAAQIAKDNQAISSQIADLLDLGSMAAAPQLSAPISQFDGLSPSDFDPVLVEFLRDSTRSVREDLERAQAGSISSEAQDLVDQALPLLRGHETQLAKVGDTL